MEAFYKYAFLGSDGTLAALLYLATVVRAVDLIWSLPGVVVTMTGGCRAQVAEEDFGAS